MSTIPGLIIKSGRPTLPQFRFRPMVSTQNTLVNTWVVVLGPVGDVLVDYVSQIHATGLNRVLDCRVTVDGVVLLGQTTHVDGNLRWYNLDSFQDALSPNVAESLFGSDVPVYAQSLLVESRAPVAATNFFTNVRYVQL